MDEQPPNSARWAVHEAGHAVVAHALGIRVFIIEPVPDETGAFRTGMEVREDHDPFVMAAVSLAGGCAEQHQFGDPGVGFGDDLAEAIDLVGEGPMLVRAGWLAHSILNDRFKCAQFLAADLIGEGSLDEAHIAGVLGKYDEGGSTLSTSPIDRIVPDDG